MTRSDAWGTDRDGRHTHDEEIDAFLDRVAARRAREEAEYEALLARMARKDDLDIAA